MPLPPASRSGRHVVLTGQMGVGKSTLAEALASALGRPHADCDDDLSAAVGATAAAYADAHGVEALHAAEARVLLDRLAEDDPLVVSAAASVVESAACRAALGAGALVVWLDAEPLDVARRSSGAGHRRSLEREEVLSLDARRRPLYRSLADVTIAPGTPVDDAVAAVLAIS